MYPFTSSTEGLPSHSISASLLGFLLTGVLGSIVALALGGTVQKLRAQLDRPAMTRRQALFRGFALVWGGALAVGVFLYVV